MHTKKWDSCGRTIVLQEKRTVFVWKQEGTLLFLEGLNIFAKS